MILVLAATALAVSAAPPPVVSGDVGAKLDRYLTESKFEGVALVAKDGNIVLKKGYGVANRETGEPWAADSLVSVGSITKQFTAAAILKLEMEGKLAVEDTIPRFLADVPEDKKGITLHHLLTHTAGLDSDFAGDYDAVGRDEYVRRTLASKLRSKPGAEHHYANSGYSLLAAIVEKASGQSYETYLRDRLLLPAGATETGYRIPKWDARRVPVGYRDGKRWGTMLEQPWGEDGPYWALRGNGGIESTLADLWAWSRALDGDAVLSGAARKKLFTAHVQEGPGADSHYAYGWAVFTTPWGKRLVAHDGGNGIFSADFRRYVDDGIVVITGAADAGIKAWKHSGPLARIARGEDVAPQPPAAVKLAPLGTSGRHAVARAWFAAFNAPDPTAAMQGFRETHASPSAPKMPEADRAAMLRRLLDDLGSLEPEGVIEDTAGELAVRAKPGRGPAAVLRFRFDPQGKFAGLGVQVGD